ncbi:MAG: amidase family protein [Alphaproteobacteria bacterium]|nr:amidase family protein [Alphaproteobacteria bacterium]
MATRTDFDVIETTVADIHAAYRSGALSARQLVQTYLDRIAAYDQEGPAINAVISLNPGALDDADRLDAAFRDGGPVGPLHGIPVLIKDQADLKGLPTTMGSVLFRDYLPDRDAFVVARLKAAGAIFLGKTTLGEMGGGDTHGSLFGSTRNVYDLTRTAGGSSGGSGAAVSANFCTVAIGQEGFSSIRRPAIWNGVAGMRPTAGLVSRSGVLSGWPSVAGTLGPMARTVTDLAKLLDCMVAYDPDDPLTARGFGRAPESYAGMLDAGALEGARIGVLRESLARNSEPESDDFKKVTEVFDRAVAELADAGAELIDPVTIPDVAALLAQRSEDGEAADRSFETYMGRSARPPYRSLAELRASPLIGQVTERTLERLNNPKPPEAHCASLKARELLMTRLLQVMADHRLDAIVHKAVEHQPTLIEDGINPPYVSAKGAPHINTFLVFVPSVVVPAGFTADDLPAGITFLGRPYDDANMIRFAYAYEQATGHRRVPASTP